MSRLIKTLFALPLAATLLSSCVTNAVTGKEHVQFHDIEWEKKQGEAMYLAMRQSQGGEYIREPRRTQYV